MKTSIRKNFVTDDNITKAEMGFIKTEKLSLVNLILISDINSEYKLRLAHSGDVFLVDSIFGKDNISKKVNIDDIKDIISNIKDVIDNNTSKFSLTLKTDDSNHNLSIYNMTKNCIDFIVNCEGTGLFVPVKKEDGMMLLFDKFLNSIE